METPTPFHLLAEESSESSPEIIPAGQTVIYCDDDFYPDASF